MEANSEFSSILKELIFKKDISIQSLAEECKISRRQIHNYLAGTHQPPLDKFLILMKVLDADPNEIASVLNRKPNY